MNNLNNNQDKINLEDLNDFKFIFIILFLLSMVAYGFLAFNLTITGDEWRSVYEPLDNMRWFLTIGRWGNVLLWHLFHNNVFAPALTLFLACALFIFSGYIGCKLFSIKNKIECTLFISLFLFSPILAEPFSYKFYHIGYGVSVFLVMLSLYFIKKIFNEKNNLRSIILSKYLFYIILMLTFSFGTYQSAALLFLCTSFALLLIRFSKLSKIRTLIKEALVIFSFGIISIVLSLLISKLILIICKISPTSAEKYTFGFINSISDLLYTLERFLSYFSQFLFREQHLWPFPVKLVYLVFLVVFSTLFLFHSKIIKFHSIKVREFKPVKFLFFLLFLCLFLISPWILGIIRIPPNSYRHNALLGLIMVYPFIVVYAIKMINNIKIKIGLRVLAIYIVISFMAFQNVASLATYTSNMRDMHVASNILSKVEILNNKSDFKRLFLFGTTVDRDKRPFRYGVRGGLKPMGTSAVEWGVLSSHIFRIENLMRMVSFRDKNDFVGVTTASISWRLILRLTKNRRENKKILLKKVQESDIWPSNKSVVFMNENVIVFLDQDSKNRTIQILKKMLE